MNQMSVLPSRDSFRVWRMKSVWAGKKKKVVIGMCDKCHDKKDKEMLQGIREEGVEFGEVAGVQENFQEETFELSLFFIFYFIGVTES